MRALSQRRLAKEGFKVYEGNQNIDPYTIYKLQDVGDLIEIEQKVELLSLLYKDSRSSIRVIKNPFYIDSYGNQSPPKNVSFGGEMGRRRVADMLPLNYELPKKN